jgi:sensor histidine kinase YesM
MESKKLYIQSGVSISDWVTDNHNQIINSIYDNIFEFMDNEVGVFTVLTVTTKHASFGTYGSHQFDGVAFEFLLIKEDIINTIDALITNFEEIEDYEKCEKLTKLKELYAIA